MNLDADQLRKLKEALPKMSTAEKQKLMELLAEKERRDQVQKCRSNLLEFVKYVDPDYKIGAHHRHLAKILEDMAYGRKSRATVSIAPRMGKSRLASELFPSWFIGNFPKKKILMVSHTTDLAVDFGRKVRNLVDSVKYKDIFPDVTLAADSKSAGRWSTNHMGEYFACGVGSALAGRGGDMILVDDPHNEQEILNGNYEIFERAFDWYRFGLRTRLMPGGSICIVATRWATNDLIGSVIQDQARNPDGDVWDVVEFPAILNDGTPEAKSLWPEQWPLETLQTTKASMPPFQWNAQYMQNPTSKEGSIINRTWWREWEEDEPPDVEYIIMSLDAAAESNNRADYTGITTWGVFYLDNEKGEPFANIILLNGIKERMDFPTLKRRALQEYEEWKPDAFIVEKKSNGVALYQELRSTGVPVLETTPHRGSGDKTARLNSVAPLFEAGLVWYPVGRRWAEEVVEEVSTFPACSHDDLVDCTQIAMARFRNGGFIKLPTDYNDDDDRVVRAHRKYY